MISRFFAESLKWVGVLWKFWTFISNQCCQFGPILLIQYIYYWNLFHLAFDVRILKTILNVIYFSIITDKERQQTLMNLTSEKSREQRLKTAVQRPRRNTYVIDKVSEDHNLKNTSPQRCVYMKFCLKLQIFSKSHTGYP